jgi:hypothetical protein
MKHLLVVLFAAAIVLRLGALAAPDPASFSPDGARFFNIARAIARGQGFSTPEAWPAWMNPERLPMAETFKEPAYPYAIAALTPVARTPFRAGQAVSLIAGLAIPFLVHRLVRRLEPDRAAAAFALFLVALSPLLVSHSVLVAAESLFVAALLGAFVAAARPPGPETRAVPWHAIAAGALAGLAFLVRGQALIAAPALAMLLARGPGGRVRLARWGAALVAALVVASPLLVRNVAMFGTPLHNDATAFGVWPYVDQLRFSHGLERPPAPLPFLVGHLPDVLAHAFAGLKTFLRYTLPNDVLGHPVWYAALAAGVPIAIARWRTWGFAVAFLALSMPFLLAVHWAPRYFASLAPFLCIVAALGAAWLWRRLLAVAPARFAVAAAAVALAVMAVLHAGRGFDMARRTFTPELDAARAEAAFLTSRLAPDEAIMVDMTSYWAWFSDRNAVHLVIDREDRVEEVLRRLKVRYAALPTANLEEYARRYPGGALPDFFVPDHENPEHGVSVFRIVH